jgi:hypothetical protein
MFETIPETLNLLAEFAIVGFMVSVGYEFLRTFRLLVRHNTMFLAVEDFLFLCAAAFAAFAYSIYLGNGFFRIYYLSGMLFGAVVYFTTIGRVISYCLKKSIGFVKKAVKKVLTAIFTPVVKVLRKIYIWCRSLLGKIAQKSQNKLVKLHKNIIYLKKRLQSAPKKVYNNSSTLQTNHPVPPPAIKAVIKPKIIVRGRR